MNPLFARYPFLARARDAVEAAELDMETVLREEDSPVVDRAVARVRATIADGQVPDPVGDPSVEVLSYPVARVLISLIDDPVLTDRYALAEARRAYEYVREDLSGGDELRSSRQQRISLPELLEDFSLTEAVTPLDSGYSISVTAYLSLVTEMRGRSWRLISRDLADGHLTVTQQEFEELLREAIRVRVAEGLPLSVPPAIAAALEDEVTQIENTLADIPIPDDVDRVIPNAFPPCMNHLLEALRAGDTLTSIEQFAILSFLSAIGLDEDDLVEFVDPADESLRAQLRYAFSHLHGGTSSTAYPPPSCATLDAAGGCVEDPDRCFAVGNPLTAYAQQVANEQSAHDWRDDRSSKTA